MAFQQIPGDGLWLPAIPRIAIGAPSFTSMLIDATGEKAAFCGRVFRKDRAASKDITKVGFRFGTVTKAGGSGLTVSLQDVSLTAGGPIQPDETQDQTVAIANGDAGFTSNAWYQTGALSANRTVSHGDLLAVVVEYDGGGRLGADAVNLTGLNVVSNADVAYPASVLKTAGWAIASLLPNVILEFTDGVLGTLCDAWPCSATAGVTAYNSGSTPDENALEFQLPFTAKAEGAWLLLNQANSSSDWDLVLYEGTTAKATTSIDGNTGSTATRFVYIPFATEVTILANTPYRLSLKPTTANNVQLFYFDVSAANHLQAHAGGPTWALTTRTDAGSWAAITTTRRPMMGLKFSQFDDGAGGGGGRASIIGC